MSRGAKISIIVFFIVLFIIGIVMSIQNALRLPGTEINISANSILEINLTGDLKDRVKETPGFLGKSRALSLTEIRNALQYAAKDDRIIAIIIEPGLLSAGFGKIQELASIITEFKHQSPKPVYAYIEMCFPKEYYLATYCDSILAVPTGYVIVNGIASSVYYLKQGLHKLGIQADYIAIGKYKNAPEMFTRDRLSEDQKEVMNDFLDQYYQDLIQTIAKNRSIDVKKIQSLVNIGFFSSEKAKQMGLVDHLTYPTELVKKFGSSVSVVKINQYVKAMKEKMKIHSPNKIAVIYAQGTIFSGKGDLESNIYATSFIEMIQKIKKNRKIKGVILRINSPGGSGTASEIIWRSLQELKESKPLIVSVSDMAASGGYYMAMTGDSIFANPGSIVGSIGVFAGKFSFAELYHKLGINKETLYRGKSALMFDENRPFSSHERQILTENLDEFYKNFVQKVADARHKTWDEIHAIAQGRIWTGTEGMQNGLVDGLGDLERAIQSMRNKLNLLPEESIELVYYPRRKPFFEKLLEEFQTNNQPVGLIKQVIEEDKATGYFLQFAQFNPLEPIAMVPYYMEFK